MKTCSKCGIEKHEREFNRRSAVPCGLQSDCKTCDRKRKSEFRRAHPEKIAEYNKRPTRKKAHNRMVRSWERAFPHKVAAKQAVKYALEKGTMFRQPCWVCGEKAHAHHASYAKDAKLDVTWLCHDHHMQVHREAKEYLRAGGQHD